MFSRLISRLLGRTLHRQPKRTRRCVLAFERLEPRCLLTSFFVATTGDDANDGLSVGQAFRSIQHALDQATSPGDDVFVRGGAYNEKVSFKASGSALGGYITLQPYAAEEPVLDGTGVADDNMVLIQNKSYVKLIGFEIKNNLGVDDGSAVRVIGAGSHIEIRDNVIHEMRGESAMAVTVYGTSSTAISDIVIDGNEVFDCEPAPSEAITLNGNVKGFAVTNNVVHDVNNIGIDLIGGEKSINPNRKLVARDGVVSGNTVYNARSNYGGGFAAGIYVDGGKNIVVENNISHQNDMGIEIGAENRGITTKGVIVRNNIVHHNDKAGIVFGGFAKNKGRVEDCYFVNNTLYKNDTLNEGLGQLWIQYASNNVVANNIFVAGDNGVLLYSEKGNVDNTLDYNLWFSESGDKEWTWRGKSSDNLNQFQNQSGQESHGLWGDPLFLDAANDNYYPMPASPAIDAGSDQDGWFAPTDFNGTQRPFGAAPDIGAFELG